MEQKVFKENIDYQFIEIEDVDVSAIKLLCGKYTGVVYCYGAASVNEEGIAARLKFDYIIIEAGNYSAEQLTVDEEFHTMIGDILVEMIAIEGRNEQT